MATQPKAADLRTQAARELLARSEHEQVELVALTGLDLCVLGAPKHVLCEEDLADAWLKWSWLRRRKAIKLTTETLVKRGHLTVDGSKKPSDIESYAMDPALGIVLAARSRPAYVVVTALGTTGVRTPRMYALGDEEKPVRAVVVELPEALPLPPEQFPHLVRMGPVGRLYRHVLVSRETATQWLTSWLFQSVAEEFRPPDRPLPARLVSVYHQGEGNALPGSTAAFRNGEDRLQLLKDDAEDSEVVDTYDQDGVRRIIGDLMLGR